jgi:hypothetical protein
MGERIYKAKEAIYNLQQDNVLVYYTEPRDIINSIPVFDGSKWVSYEERHYFFGFPEGKIKFNDFLRSFSSVKPDSFLFFDDGINLLKKLDEELGRTRWPNGSVSNIILEFYDESGVSTIPRGRDPLSLKPLFIEVNAYHKLSIDLFKSKTDAQKWVKEHWDYNF